MSRPILNARPVCHRCWRAGGTCYCAEIRPFDAGFDLVLLAHPKEARNRVGTLRIAKLSVRQSQLIVGGGEEFDHDPRILRYLENPAYYCAVLFPGDDAIEIETSSQPWLPPGKRLALFVIDGTWNQAKAMLRRSAVLSRLQRLSFVPDRESEYEFREQPMPYCLSTVEAVHTVIERLALTGVGSIPDGRKHDRMLDVFRDLVKFQLRCEQEN